MHDRTATIGGHPLGVSRSPKFGPVFRTGRIHGSLIACCGPRCSALHEQLGGLVDVAASSPQRVLRLGARDTEPEAHQKFN